MYISEISGHHSATLAIEKALRILQPDTEILNINAFNYTNPISEKIVNRLYISIIKRTPQIWDYLYDNPTILKNVERIKETIHKFNSPKLKDLFETFKPDAVLCTQAFPCGMTADFKKTYNMSIPLIAVLTDYVPHSYWIYDTVDYYITPSEETSLRLAKKGVTPDKIKALGIPFDPVFNEPQDRNKICQKLKVNPKLFTVLIMGGGQGLGPIKAIVKSLEKIKREIQEIIVTGTNKRLYNSLKRQIKDFKKKPLLFRYVNNIYELMSASDIIITKPGGVTCAEVLAKNLPMIIVKPIPGQEANNANYFTEKGAAIKIDEPEEIDYIIDDLLANPIRLKKIKAAQARISKPNASFDIARLLLSL
jgi:processive 1,2-diacylglycerol beta-glucosyltransferase